MNDQGVMIQLDLKRRLRFTRESYLAAAEKAGVHWRQLPAFFAEKGTEALPIFVWGGLVDEDPGLTVEDVRELLETHCVTPVDMARLGLAIAKAVDAFLDEARLREVDRLEVDRVIRATGLGIAELTRKLSGILYAVLNFKMRFKPPGTRGDDEEIQSRARRREGDIPSAQRDAEKERGGNKS